MEDTENSTTESSNISEESNNQSEPSGDLGLSQLDSAEAAFSLLIAEAQRQAEVNLSQALQQIEDPDEKEKAKWQIEKQKFELQRNEQIGKQHIQEIRRVVEVTGIPVEFLANVPAGDTQSLHKLGDVWLKQHPKTQSKDNKESKEVSSKKEVEPEGTKETSETSNPPSNSGNKKLDSGVSGTSAGNQDWRNLPSSQKIALGLQQRKG